uniref:Glutaredoxin-2, mitochondrial n=1 Tax=Leptobrachium leishanense TaxID=445787 RepID=A0A8C5R0Q9_9ANUR
MWLLPALRCTGRKRSTLTYRDPLHPQSRRMGSFFSSDAPQPEIINTVKDTISENCVVIFSKTACPYCTMAKDAFRDLDVSYKVVELDQVEHGGQIQTILHKMTGARTVPRVFVNGSCIGGGTETRRLKEEGKLLDLVRQCGLGAAS